MNSHTYFYLLLIWSLIGFMLVVIVSDLDDPFKHTGDVTVGTVLYYFLILPILIVIFSIFLPAKALGFLLNIKIFTITRQ